MVGNEKMLPTLHGYMAETADNMYAAYEVAMFQQPKRLRGLKHGIAIKKESWGWCFNSLNSYEV